jgi:dTDP-4-amino-4,6-dideoxygalactose transaminase
LIAFNVPHVPEISKTHALRALESEHQQGDGYFTKRVSGILSELLGGGHVLLTTSCTHALEMASMLLNLGPGDEVIMPSYNFTSAAISVAKFGAKPVFVDIDPVTKCIDLDQTEEAISPWTRAISWVNYAGMSPNIESLKDLAREYDLFLIEDNAHGLGGKYNNKPLGSFGDFAVQSFHATKNIQCGEGGALVINNPEFIERAEIIREKGTNRSKFIRGEVQKYQWVDHGSSYLMPEVLAAILLGQLESLEFIQSRRQIICAKYKELNFSEGSMSILTEALSVAHMYFIEFKQETRADAFRIWMKKNGIDVRTHYQPLHNSLFGRRFASIISEMSNSEMTSKTLIRLPIWPGLQDSDLHRINAKATTFFNDLNFGRSNETSRFV